ncbi:MAG TPA: DUF134 domain-containing protein [Dehalococcoidia bacterium]|nr:DUF134 domain-containing protein [Dehalococcoidia bacterium]
MPRPPKCRRVAFIPDATYFKPAGIPMRVLDEVVMSLEEAEAIRLKDLEGLEQEEGARRMNVSRPTFQRVLAAARQKLADALLRGKAIRIGGGNFEMAQRRFRCFNGHEWDIPIEVAAGRNPASCPTCRNVDITLVAPVGGNYGGRGQGRHRGGRRGM